MHQGDRNLSPEALEAWNQLNEETRKVIQKHNPFKWNRDRAILELKAKGIRSEILAELTGLNRGSIFRIAKKEALIPEKQRQEIRGLVDTFNDLLKALMRLLTNTSRRENESKQSRVGNTKDHQ